MSKPHNTELSNSEPSNNPQESPRYRGIYLLPNLLTTAALFAGFYAIVAAMKGLFEYAAIAIFIAMIMDTLDGRVARLTKTQSAFGAQYDSLSDMVSFGIAPALVSYNWGLSELGKPGWIAAFIFAATGALRLARFNVQTAIVDKRYFVGLPIPAAAAVVAGMVWLGTELAISGKNLSMLVAFIVSALGILMVSYFKYYSFKEIDFKNHVPYMAMVILILSFSLIAWNPPIVLFTVFFIYALSGPALWFRNRFRKESLVNAESDLDVKKNGVKNSTKDATKDTATNTIVDIDVNKQERDRKNH